MLFSMSRVNRCLYKLPPPFGIAQIKYMTGIAKRLLCGEVLSSAAVTRQASGEVEVNLNDNVALMFYMRFSLCLSLQPGK